MDAPRLSAPHNFIASTSSASKPVRASSNEAAVKITRSAHSRHQTPAVVPSTVSPAWQRELYCNVRFISGGCGFTVIPHRTAGRGCRVGTVIEFGQADQAGICPNDAIVSVSGVSVEGASPNEIAASLNRTRPVEVTFRRSPEEGATVPPKQLDSLPDVVQKRHQIERHERHQIGGPEVANSPCGCHSHSSCRF